MDTDKKICVAGVGAIGGLLSAMLGRRYSESLSLIARGARAETLRQKGVVLHSEYYGNGVVTPKRVAESSAEIGVQDYIFVCVKNYSLDQIAENLRPAVGEHTVIVPVLNGIEAGDHLRELFPNAIVCDAVIYTITASCADFSISQKGSYSHMFIGSKIKDKAHVEGAKAAYELLRSVDFDIRWADDIESEIWQKYILNCAYNTITARHLATSGMIRNNELLKKDAYALLSETYQVGIAEGVSLPGDIVEQKYRFIMEKHAPDATSSMRRDMEAKRPIEFDAFSGAVIRRAALHGIDVPVTKKYHLELSEAVRSWQTNLGQRGIEKNSILVNGEGTNQ